MISNEGKTLISNDSDPLDRIGARGNKPRCVITLTDVVRFGACCVVVPGKVFNDLVECVVGGKDLRNLLSSESNPSKINEGNVIDSVSFFGLIGAAVGVGATVASGNYANMLANVAGGFVLAPIAAINVVNAGIGLCHGLPFAFRAASDRVLRSGAYTALQSGAARNGNAHIYADRPRLQGPR